MEKRIIDLCGYKFLIDEEKGNIELYGDKVDSDYIFEFFQSFLASSKEFKIMLISGLKNYVLESQVNRNNKKEEYSFIDKILDNDYENMGFINRRITSAASSIFTDEDLLQELARKAYIRKYKRLERKLDIKIFKDSFNSVIYSDIAELLGDTISFKKILEDLDEQIGRSVKIFILYCSEWDSDTLKYFDKILDCLNYCDDPNAEKYISIINQFRYPKRNNNVIVLDEEEVRSVITISSNKYLLEDVDLNDRLYEYKNELIYMHGLESSNLNIINFYLDTIFNFLDKESVINLFTDEFKEKILYEASLNDNSIYKNVYNLLIKSNNIPEKKLFIEALKYYRNNPDKLFDLYCDEIDDKFKEKNVNKENIKRYIRGNN